MIEALSRPPSPDDLDQLARLLVDAVDSGASVSFMSPFSVDDAREWWRRTVDRADPRALILVARDDSGIVGSVSMHPAWPPNQPHRANIAKLLVHRRARRRGIARALMTEIEARARGQLHAAHARHRSRRSGRAAVCDRRLATRRRHS